MAKVLVASAFYNESWNAEQTVQSILSQTFSDIELVCVDDGSTDDTLAVLRSIRDPRVRIISQRNAGLGAALRRAFAETSAEFLAYHEAGDKYDINRLAKQIDVLEEHRNVGAVSCYSRAVSVSEDHTSEARVEDVEEAISNLARANPFPHSCAMYRRSAYERAGGYREFFRYRQDLDLLLRLTETTRLAVVPEILVTTYRHSESVSVKPEKRILARRFREFAVYCAVERRKGNPDPLEAIGPGSALAQPRSKDMASDFVKDAVKATWRGDREAAETFVKAALGEGVSMMGLAAAIGIHLPLPVVRSAYRNLRGVRSPSDRIRQSER